jgi:CubicO group peptidase (beta-lactamase class C family)
MRQPGRRSYVARFIIAAALAVCVAARPDAVSRLVDPLARDIIDTKRSAALGIAIDEGGKTLLDKGYGLADIERNVKATPDTIYRIGSVTKQFTAVAIIQLVDAGKLTLDEPLTMALPDYPAPPKPITIKNLLQHTSGIPNFTSLPSYMPAMAQKVTHADMVARFAALPLDFEPGAKWNYSNSAYYLLGMIIERASGETYADYLTKLVLAPVGLKHTQYEAPDGSGRAQGYHRENGALSVAQPINMTQPFSAGALVSTPGDLVKWMRALVEHRVTPADALDRVTSDTVPVKPDGDERYGYGIGVSVKDGRKIISHGGGINGFVSLLAYFPETDRTIAIIANADGVNLAALMTQIIDGLDKTGKKKSDAK